MCSFGPLLKINLTNSLWLQMCNMLGLGDMNADQLASKLEETLPVIRSVSEQFKDPVSPFVISITGVWSYVEFMLDHHRTLCFFIRSECAVSIFSSVHLTEQFVYFNS